MPQLVITCPGQSEQVLDLSAAAVTIGRGEDCTAFIAEKKASRRHLAVRVTRAGFVVAEDLDSSNGTCCIAPSGEEQRFVRRVLEAGDTLHIGATTIVLRAGPEGAAAPVISGTLQLQPSAPPAVMPPAETRPAETTRRHTQAATQAVRRDPEPRVDGAAERKSMTRGLILCAVAVAVFAGVELYLGGKAERRSLRREAHLDALRTLDHVGEGSEAFQVHRDAFALAHPQAPERLTLDRYLEQTREREAYVLTKRDALNQLQGQMHLAEPSEVRMRLLQLQRELPDEADYVRDVRRMLADLDRRKAAGDLDDLRGLDLEVATLRAKRAFAKAQRIVRAFGARHEGMGAEAHDRWSALRDAVDGDVQATAKALWRQVGEEQDPAARRALLAQAWPSLAGTQAGTLIAEKLRSAVALAAPRSGTSGGGVPGTRPGPRPGTRPGAHPTPAAPAVPTVMDGLLARAKAAEELLAKRDWVGGRAVLAALAEEAEGGRLQAEWKARLGEIDGLLGLVRTLAEAADQEKKPRRKLSSGSWSVTDANPKEVTLASKRKGTFVHKWADMPAEDVIALLKPARITPEQRRGVAILAANLGNRAAFVDVLLPLYEHAGDHAQIDGLVARHLYGRATPPGGGYRAYKGALLDAAGYQRRLTQERITFLRAEAARILALVAKEGAFKKLSKLKAMRTELDKRRKYALRAIFNTTHYPYPYSKGSMAYHAVQQDVDRRTARVRELWDDPIRVTVKRAGTLAKHLDAWDLVIAELKAKDVDVENLEARVRPYALYVTGEPLGIRDFYRSESERDWFAYSRWVMTAYNPARVEYASESERKQVRVTNEYRMMIGFTAAVNPGPAPYDSITKDNVVQILDQAKVVKLSPLRAVRIDTRLVKSARGHSEDMARRGYFAHQAPPDPALGKGATGPADRMMAQGYQGFGYSENIAMSASPTQAHVMWIHSSGHHRNILSGWVDMGSGVGGRNFTQNFGMGGGARPEIAADTEIHERAGRGRRGR